MMTKQNELPERQFDDFDIVGQKIRIPKEEAKQQSSQQNKNLQPKTKKTQIPSKQQNQNKRSNQENNTNSTGVINNQHPNHAQGSLTGEIKKKNQENYSSSIHLPNHEIKDSQNKTKPQGPQSKKEMREQQSSTRNPKDPLSLSKAPSRSPIRQSQNKQQKPWVQADSFEGQEIKVVRHQVENGKLRKVDQSKPQKQIPSQGVKDQDVDEVQGNQTTEDYYHLSQKFSTITDPRLFKLDEERKSNVSLSKRKYEEEIEENIEVDTLSVKNKHTEWDHDEINQSNKIEDSRNKKQVPDKNFNKRSISELKPMQNDSQPREQFLDPSEDPATSNGMKTFQGYHPAQNQWKKGKQEEQNEDSEATFTEGFYANQLKKYTEMQGRPFTPPFESVVQLQGIKQLSLRNGVGKRAGVEENGETMIDLIYDAVMNRYYDPISNQYYELKD